MAKPKVAVLIRQPLRERILSDDDLAKLKEVADVELSPHERDMTEDEVAAMLRTADGCMSSWGTPPLTSRIVDSAPGLKIWAHAAGSVKPMVADDAWYGGVTVTSAAPAIADDVAEMTMACITMGLRCVVPLSRRMAANQPVDKDIVRSLYRATVGVISASHVGRRVIDRLLSYDTRVLLYDPFVDDDEADRMGVELVGLDEMARESDAVTCHAPKLPETYHMVGESHFKAMRDDTVFVNTSRGDNIDEAALIRELQKGRLFAFLDVTSPEPAAPDSPLRTLPNVILTPHIAGAKSFRTGAMAVEELCCFFQGRAQIHEVTKDMLPVIA